MEREGTQGIQDQKVIMALVVTKVIPVQKVNEVNEVNEAYQDVYIV